jgi:GT2 family glycosyltransferase
MESPVPLPPPPAAGLELTVSAIIVSYNTRDLTLECLRTLTAALEGLTAEVWVVDNGSADGSVGAIRASFPAVKLIDAGKNLGFGAANNLAMRQARGKYLLLLNSDAFPRPGAIAALVAHLENCPDAAVAGPRLLNEDGSLQRSCFRFPSPLQAWCENLWITVLFPEHEVFGDYRHWPHDGVREVDFVIGACLLARRTVYEEVGGFDERFFMYQEEADWQRRIQMAGWKVAFTPNAEVTHLGGGSGKSEPERVNRSFFESLDCYARKHHGITGLLSIRAAMLVGCSLRATLWAVVAIAPRWRERAKAKARKHAWLVGRQLFTGFPANEPV